MPLRVGTVERISHAGGERCGPCQDRRFKTCADPGNRNQRTGRIVNRDKILPPGSQGFEGLCPGQNRSLTAVAPCHNGADFDALTGNLLEFRLATCRTDQCGVTDVRALLKRFKRSGEHGLSTKIREDFIESHPLA